MTLFSRYELPCKVIKLPIATRPTPLNPAPRICTKNKNAKYALQQGVTIYRSAKRTTQPVQIWHPLLSIYITPGTTLVGYARSIIPTIPVEFDSRHCTGSIPLQDHTHPTNYLFYVLAWLGAIMAQKQIKIKDSIYSLLLHVHEFKRVESTFLSEKNTRVKELGKKRKEDNNYN